MTLPARHVATVGGRPISIERLEERVAEVRRGPRGRHLPPGGGSESFRLQRWIVQELVTEDVLLHEARSAGIIAPDAIVPKPSPSAVATLAERVTASVTVPASEIRAYYERNADLYRRREARRIRHILLPDEPTAALVTRRLAAGEEMGALAAAVSIDAGSRTQGGDLGDVHRGELTGPFEDAIFGAEVGAIVGPIQTEHGWHVARIEAVTEPSDVPYDEARPAIEAELLAAARAWAFGAWLERRRSALVAIEPEFEHPSHPHHGAPSHRH
jgi:[acyl-carrier-protein] S-malonyltransferase